MIHLFFALRCEAQPFIEFYRMKPVKTAVIFDCYVDRHHTRSLTISGTGKLSAASAVIHTLMLLSAGNNDNWINIGIAGHDNLAVGSPVLAHKVSDPATGRTWYPQLLFNTPLSSTDLVTLDRPCPDYHANAMYDMEAAGFFDAVSRTSTLERCHSLKIISDNRMNPMQEVNRKLVRKLVGDKVELIAGFAAQISALATSPPVVDNDDPEYKQLLTQFHFTHTQGLMLKKLLQRWRVLIPGTALYTADLAPSDNSRELLASVQQHLDALEFHF